MLPTEEPVWLATLEPLELLDLGEPQVLARHDARGAAHVLDDGDADEAAFVVAEDEGRAGVGAEVHLPRHHLLHREVAGGHTEFLELQARVFPVHRSAEGNRWACPTHWSGSPGEWWRPAPSRAGPKPRASAPAPLAVRYCRRVMPCRVVIVSSRNAFVVCRGESSRLGRLLQTRDVDAAWPDI